ncbi:MAG: hypothetical protein HXS48_00835 [Theionarchaea archaeon]|nr:hypothetical protein [Theionarchaea archaeon]
MARQEGDAYPDPSNARSGRCKTKALVCTILLFICLSGFMTVVSAPGDQLPDPSCAPGPIFGGYYDGKLPVENPVITSQPIFVIE